MVEIWLYTSGDESVRLVREPLQMGGMRLVVFGPGNAQSAYAFTDVVSCLAEQARQQEHLRDRGFRLHESTVDRRTPRAAWTGEERRRR